MRKGMLTSSIVMSAIMIASALPATPQKNARPLITLPEANSPFIVFNVWIKAGSQNDPKGKEGVASLTARILAEGSTIQNSYEQIVSKLYPMAAGYDSRVDKEMTVFTGRIHKDFLPQYYELFKNAILSPAFKDEDFQRIKTQTLNFLKQSRRFSNDEELSKELLFREIYRGTPYEHPEEGYVASVESLALSDVKDFYKNYYAKNNIVLGIGGGYPKKQENAMLKDFASLPLRKQTIPPTPTPKPINGKRILIVEKNTQATPISFGYPIPVVRSSPDFYPLMLANSWLGEHRTSVSHLYQVIREKRGMNYGDYSYIEAYPKGYATQAPPTNVSRRSQIFEVWIRPVAFTEPGSLHNRTLFAFRAALREIDLLIEKGLTPEQFEIQKNFLKNYIVNFGATLSRRLAYKIDDAFYGLPAPGFLENARQTISQLTLESVNAAIKKRLQTKNTQVVFITKDAQALKQKLLKGEATTITYVGKQPESVLEEDKIIAGYPISVKESDISIINVNDALEK
jgi:zinc protease